MVPAPRVGTDTAFVFYSGPRAVFEAHQPALRVIGRPDYRGEDHALAQLYYQALLDIFLTSLSALSLSDRHGGADLVVGVRSTSTR